MQWSHSAASGAVRLVDDSLGLRGRQLGAMRGVGIVVPRAPSRKKMIRCGATPRFFSWYLRKHVRTLSLRSTSSLRAACAPTTE